MAEAGLAVALVAERAAAAAEAEGLAVKKISDGTTLAARYCLLAQRGNYRSQVVNNFLAILADAFQLDLADEMPTIEELEEV
jgi:DNA-binding transcriptional LysR family regulator